MIRHLRSIFGWLLLVVGLAFLAGEAGGLIGTNRDWREPDDGITIYVETNGFHTGFIVPAQAEGIDWQALFPPTDLGDMRYHATGATDYVAISWGERDFYLATPRWQDLNPATMARAAIGSDATLVHIYHMTRPLEGRYAAAGDQPRGLSHARCPADAGCRAARDRTAQAHPRLWRRRCVLSSARPLFAGQQLQRVDRESPACDRRQSWRVDPGRAPRHALVPASRASRYSRSAHGGLSASAAR